MHAVLASGLNPYRAGWASLYFHQTPRADCARAVLDAHPGRRAARAQSQIRYIMKKLLFVLPLALGVCHAPASACFDPFADATADGGTSYAVGGFLFKQVNGLGTTWYALTNTPAPPATGFPVVASGNLSYAGLPASTGNCISIPASTGVMGRLTLDFVVTNGTAYYSFLLKVTDLSGVDTSAARRITSSPASAIPSAIKTRPCCGRQRAFIRGKPAAVSTLAWPETPAPPPIGCSRQRRGA